MQEKIALSSASFANRLAFLRDRQRVTLSELAEGKASTAKSWEEGKTPRGDKWQGIAQRLRLSEIFIFHGRPETSEDYAFIEKWRNEIEEADEWLNDARYARRAGWHVSEKADGAAGHLEAIAREKLETLLRLAEGRPERLGWIIVQMDSHLSSPPNWEPHRDPTENRAVRAAIEEGRRRGFRQAGEAIKATPPEKKGEHLG